MTINEIITIIDVLVITTYYFYLHCYVDFKMRRAESGEGRGQGEKKARKKQQTRQKNEAAIIIEDFFVHPTY